MRAAAPDGRGRTAPNSVRVMLWTCRTQHKLNDPSRVLILSAECGVFSLLTLAFGLCDHLFTYCECSIYMMFFVENDVVVHFNSFDIYSTLQYSTVQINHSFNK